MTTARRFCPKCGAQVTFRIPEGDNRERATCDSCQHIDYDNPRIITGTLPRYDGKILLCKRNIEPRLGYWTLPAGFMENQESTKEGAIRETLEECGSKVLCQQLYSMISIPQINQVHMIYLADLENADFHPTPESSEVQLFSLEDIPWEQLSFASVRQTLQHFVEDSKQGHYPLHEDTLYLNNLMTLP
ncbi:NUDIX hydrolase [Marinomonas agarivorans]|nr:NUDIX hydrolase [Marinomonas agarivorans]